MKIFCFSSNSLILLSFLLTFCLTGCDGLAGGDKERIENQQHFVRTYKKIETLSLNQKDNRCIAIFLETKGVDVSETLPFHQKHNDLSYNRQFRYFPGAVGYVGLTTDFEEIDISCSKDFNSSYPAGSSLNKIVRFFSVSAYPFIISGYKNKFNRNLTPLSKLGTIYLTSVLDNLGFIHNNNYVEFDKSDLLPIFPIDKLVSDLKKEDMTLLGSFSQSKKGYLCHLYFEELPTTSGDYEIIVKMKGDDGKTYSVSITMTF